MRSLGRRSEIINVDGVKVYPAEVEAMLLDRPGVLDATVRGQPSELLGQVVVAPSHSLSKRQQVTMEPNGQRWLFVFREKEILARIPMRRFGTVEEIAAQIAWLCSEDCSFATGAVFDLSGGRATY